MVRHNLTLDDIPKHLPVKSRLRHRDMKSTTPPTETNSAASPNGRDTVLLNEPHKDPERTTFLPIALLQAMRPKQWSKNVLLFAGLLFALKFTDGQAILRSLAGFGLFCLFSSSVYIINDLRDREKDRLNPRTAKRPIASGALKPAVAIAAVSVILPVTFVLSYLLSPAFALVGAIYMAKDFGYSFGLKHLVIIDVMLIAAGFTL